MNYECENGAEKGSFKVHEIGADQLSCKIEAELLVISSPASKASECKFLPTARR